MILLLSICRRVSKGHLDPLVRVCSLCDGSKYNYSPHEREMFDKMATEWWDFNGPFVPLHTMNRVRVPWIVNTICGESLPDKPLAGLSLLDVGCGGGLLTIPLAKLGAKVTAIDISSKSISVCERILSKFEPGLKHESLIDFRHVSVEKMASDYKGKFDAVIASEVVDHIDDVGGFVSACAHLLKEEGHFFVSTINRTFYSWLFIKIAAEYVLNIIPKGMHSYSKFVTPNELKYHLLSNNIIELNTQGLLFDPFRRHWHLTSFEGMNYAMRGKKRQNQ